MDRLKEIKPNENNQFVLPDEVKESILTIMKEKIIPDIENGDIVGIYGATMNKDGSTGHIKCGMCHPGLVAGEFESIKFQLFIDKMFQQRAAQKPAEDGDEVH